jgi:hypothetical protein
LWAVIKIYVFFSSLAILMVTKWTVPRHLQVFITGAQPEVHCEKCFHHFPTWKHKWICRLKWSTEEHQHQRAITAMDPSFLSTPCWQSTTYCKSKSYLGSMSYLPVTLHYVSANTYRVPPSCAGFFGPSEILKLLTFFLKILAFWKSLDIFGFFGFFGFF